MQSPRQPFLQAFPSQAGINYIFYFYVVHLYIRMKLKIYIMAHKILQKGQSEAGFTKFCEMNLNSSLPPFLSRSWNTSTLLILSKAKARSQFRVYALVLPSAWNTLPLRFGRSIRFELWCPLLAKGFASSSTSPSASVSARFSCAGSGETSSLR